MGDPQSARKYCSKKSAAKKHVMRASQDSKVRAGRHSLYDKFGHAVDLAHELKEIREN
jgi:hypothetical protein